MKGIVPKGRRENCKLQQSIPKLNLDSELRLSIGNLYTYISIGNREIEI